MSDPWIADATIGSIYWETGLDGKIIPVAILTSPKGLEGSRISCQNSRNLVDNKLGPGAVIEIKKAINEVVPFPYLSGVITPSEVPPTHPSKCPSCGAETKWDGLFLVCPSMECTSQSRVLIFRFLGFCIKPVDLDIRDIVKWLDEFPVNFGYSRILSLYDFLVLFGQVPNRNTGPRFNLLIEKFGTQAGGLLHTLENNIQTKLNLGLTPTEFWYVLNIKGVDYELAKKLGSLNPQTLNIGNLESELKKLDWVSYPVRSSIESLFSKWKILSKMFRIVETKRDN